MILGPPGVGKGTLAARLVPALGACHLSTGDVFRHAGTLAASPLSPALRAALDAIAHGHLASDAVVLALLDERRQCLSCTHGFLLDGFPRTVGQAQQLEHWLDEQGRPLHGAIYLHADEAVIVDRLGGRRVCRACRRSCHLTHDPPAVEGRCDACGGALRMRDDDRADAVAVRLRHDAEIAPPLVAFYRERGLLWNVEAVGTPLEVFARVMALARRGAHRHDVVTHS